ncbi:hypothetical protein ACKI19_45060, partial [Streptomyces caniscabiei]|uniref:hypothetical protein n=1 Tax=Streptomyces caniscabiei TaxID=2746961 RepID=UPI0038F76033
MAMRELREKIPDLVFLVVGKKHPANSFEINMRLELLVRNFGLTENVVIYDNFYNTSDDIINLMGAVHFMVSLYGVSSIGSAAS